MASPPYRDTYWDPHLSRINLAEPVFEDLATSTGLARMVGAGRMMVAVRGDPHVRRYLLERARIRGEQAWLDLGHGDAAPLARPLVSGEPVNLSWTFGSSFWGTRVHVTSVAPDRLLVQYPVTVYRFPVRERLWASVEDLARIFRGFDLTLDDVTGLHPVNNRKRVLEILSSAAKRDRPALLHLCGPGTLLPGHLAPGPQGLRPDAPVPPATVDFRLGGSDLVGLGWRPGLSVVVSVLVDGLTVGFRTQTAGGRDARVSLAWPASLYRRQRRAAPRLPVGAQGLVDVRTPLIGALGVSTGIARPHRVLDVSGGGLGLVYEARVADQLENTLREAEMVLYDRLRFEVTLEVVDRVPFGPSHVRLSCAFRGLDPKRRRAIEVLCGKLQGSS